MKNQNMVGGAVLAACLLLALLAGLASPSGRETKPETGDTKQTPLSTAAPVRTAPERGSDIIPLTEKEEQLLDQLLSMMERGDLAGTASSLDRNEEILERLLTEKFDGTRKLYGKEGVSLEIEGRGIVLQSPSTIFYGNFTAGEPNGRVTALREIILEEPRYDYSVGNWKDGKMNGFGATGYFYFDGTGESDGRKAERAGTFKEDWLDGEFRFTTVNRKGDSASWTLCADNGVTRLDSRWEKEENTGNYRLPCDGTQNHTYVLKAEAVGNAVWGNWILWEQR